MQLEFKTVCQRCITMFTGSTTGPLSETSKVHTVTLFKIHFNIILPSMPRSSKWSPQVFQLQFHTNYSSIVTFINEPYTATTHTAMELEETIKCKILLKHTGTSIIIFVIIHTEDCYHYTFEFYVEHNRCYAPWISSCICNLQQYRTDLEMYAYCNKSGTLTLQLSLGS
jgi:hypothetical protein